MDGEEQRELDSTRVYSKCRGHFCCSAAVQGAWICEHRERTGNGQDATYATSTIDTNKDALVDSRHFDSSED
jgi:hypothetical protein